MFNHNFLKHFFPESNLLDSFFSLMLEYGSVSSVWSFSFKLRLNIAVLIEKYILKRKTIKFLSNVTDFSPNYLHKTISFITEKSFNKIIF
jgi:hypothetical protein